MTDYYGRVNTKNTATTKKNYSRIEGIGSVRSNDKSTARNLAEGLPSCVDHGNQIVYKMHCKSKGWD